MTWPAVTPKVQDLQPGGNAHCPRSEAVSGHRQSEGSALGAHSEVTDVSTGQLSTEAAALTWTIKSDRDHRILGPQ